MALQPRIYKDWSQAPAVLKVEEARKILRISRPTLIKLFADGTIKAVKVGQQWRVSKEALREYVGAQCPRGAAE